MSRVAGQAMFVLHRRAYGENGFLIEALTPDFGRIGLVARGARQGRRGLSALLQPFQPLTCDFIQGADLARLAGAESAGPARPLVGEQSLAGLYLNELLVKLLPRGEASPVLFARYAAALGDLQGGDLAWQLRRFERDVLTDLGWMVDLHRDRDGHPIAAPALYRLTSDPAFERADRGWPGEAILALAQDRDCPTASQLGTQRLLLRELLAPHMRSPMMAWGMLAALRDLSQG